MGGGRTLGGFLGGLYGLCGGASCLVTPLLLPGGGLLVHLGGGGGGRAGTRPTLLTLWPPCQGGRGRTLTSTRLEPSFSWSPCTILSVLSFSTSSNFLLLLRPPALSSSPQTEDSRAVY